MMNLTKISAVSINYRDGTVPKEKREAELKTRKQTNFFKLILGEREYLIEEVPSFYDYLGYIYPCCGTIAGPFFEFKDYVNFINRAGHYSAIPSTVFATLKRVSHVLSNFQNLYLYIFSIYCCQYFPK